MPRLLKKPWLDNYLEYARSMNSEPPSIWQLWSGISVIGASLKRNIWLWYRGIQFFPNQYIVLVGPPGIGKGSAINPAIDIAENTGAANFFKDSITAEKVIERLADGFLKVTGIQAMKVVKPEHSATAVALELPVFLSSTNDRKFSTLCALWDQGKFEYDTKNRGTNVVTDMSFGMVGGCTPDFIRHLTQIGSMAITGGFTARTMFVYASEKEVLQDRAFGAPTLQHNKLKDDLINDLKHIAQLNGEITFDDRAKDLWADTYIDHNTNHDADSDASVNFRSRISAHIIKLALVISVSESDRLIITYPHLKKAIEYVEEVRDKVDVVFRYVGESPLAVIQAKVLELLGKHGILKRNAIMRAVWRDGTDDQLTQILYTLEHADLIEQVDLGGHVAYQMPGLGQSIKNMARQKGI